MGFNSEFKGLTRNREGSPSIDNYCWHYSIVHCNTKSKTNKLWTTTWILLTLTFVQIWTTNIITIHMNMCILVQVTNILPC